MKHSHGWMFNVGMAFGFLVAAAMDGRWLTVCLNAALVALWTYAALDRVKAEKKEASRLLL